MPGEGAIKGVGFEVYFRTHTCGELNASNVGQQVRLAGWVNRRRDHGGLVFLDIRDRYGITQVICDPERSPEAHRIASELRSEFVVQVSGTVVPRLPGTENPNLSTGAIEVAAASIVVLNPSRTTPFPISDSIQVDESLRLKYRYLDLRRPTMRDNIVLRHRVVKAMRDYLDERGFLEIETPILMKSTPEGARDYLVPSALRCAFHQNRRFNLQETTLIQVITHGLDHAMTQHYIVAHCGAAQVKVAIFEPERFIYLDAIANRERCCA